MVATELCLLELAEEDVVCCIQAVQMYTIYTFVARTWRLGSSNQMHFAYTRNFEERNDGARARKIGRWLGQAFRLNACARKSSFHTSC